jgi:hypothetical protein
MARGDIHRCRADAPLWRGSATAAVAGRALVFVVVISGLLLAAGESDGDEPVSVLYPGYEGHARKSTSQRKNICGDFAVYVRLRAGDRLRDGGVLPDWG